MTIEIRQNLQKRSVWADGKHFDTLTDSEKADIVQTLWEVLYDIVKPDTKVQNDVGAQAVSRSNGYRQGYVARP